jgi:hypothetical protein
MPYLESREESWSEEGSNVSYIQAYDQKKTTLNSVLEKEVMSIDACPP